MSASSNTTNGDLPPSSSDSFLPVPAVALRIARPTSVEPVKAILSTPACATSAAPVAPSPVTMLTTPGGSPVSTQIAAKASAVKRREFRRLQHQSIAGCERRGDLPGQHKQREIPRNDLPAHPDRLGPRKLTVDQRGPTGMMIEMAGDQRNVDIARLADRLAIVDRFQNRQETLALLHVARERIKMLRPLEAGERRPFGLSLPRRGDRCVDVGRRALRGAGDPFAGRGIEDIEQVAGFVEDAVDEMPEARLVLFEPRSDVLGAFGRRTVVHRAQDVLDDAHRSLKPSRGGRRPNSARSHNGRADARCR